MYHCKTLQMPKLIKEEAHRYWPVNKEIITSQKFSHLLPMEQNVLKNYAYLLLHIYIGLVISKKAFELINIYK